jgi:PIN domain nuclease of toxin-antitoxin system
MKILLDTQIIIWAQLEPSKITRTLASFLEDEANEIWYSSISAWEIFVLIEKGRIKVKGDTVAWIEKALEGLREAPLNKNIAIQSRRIDVPHNDPADRFIAATAQIYDLVLATSDAHLLRVPGLSIFRG